MSGLGRTIDPITAPNQSFKGDILNTSSAPSIKAHAAKGRNTSGRSWKLRPQKRASSLITKNRANNRSKSWETKQQERNLSLEIKSAQQTMIEERIQAKRDKRGRRLENERRRMENEYNNAKKSTQVLNHKKLSNTMKKMNKKQLRQIKKTRMNTKTGVVEFVGAYEK
jgi:rRNA-processing protein CGR1